MHICIFLFVFVYIIEYVCVFLVRWCDDWPLRQNGVWQKIGIDFLRWKVVYVFVFVFLCAFVFVFVFVFERCDDWKPITWPAERGVALKGHQLPRARFVTRSLQSISTTPSSTSYSDLSLRLLKQSFAKACNLFCNQVQFITQH